MRLVVVKSDTGEEILREAKWPGELPRVGDIVELHSGPTQRWRVDEVDWVFEDAPSDAHDDVPLRCAKICVSVAAGSNGKPSEEIANDALCACGHRFELHTPTGCKGRAGYCECHGFTAHA
jgi:hypothetical protein